ncbi:helix-turn-helix domain-containing protein [Alteromonas lipolytica]|uniref:HTH cro/C1-type domain-containing protein n=1 Tax=Alteromonas lipolytica TaxID=1856405 RepID=A0A1E8FDR2_9ALTE|nr:helix-turn-helix domain-containing protein [Alteromonas lipolytica]OFI33728.1 hypothetical protein BFC17_19320 [Alteromonas lipolytica]GGF68944.1 transcriptional regulator [Alteromonas lipolytica]
MNENVSQQIAGQIKQRRALLGWSLDRLSAASGVSKAMLGQIERQESSPTVATLWKIATGLSCSFSDLIEDSDSPVSVKQSEKPVKGDDFFKVKTLFRFDPHTRLEMFELTISQHHCQWSEPHSVGVQEHIVVQSGALRLYFDGRWHELKGGDSCRFYADQPHAYEDCSGETRFIDVIYYPLTES